MTDPEERWKGLSPFVKVYTKGVYNVLLLGIKMAEQASFS